MRQIYYMGTGLHTSGHYLHRQGMETIWRPPPSFPLQKHETLDSTFAPGRPDAEAPQGQASLWHGYGWTILSFWDRSGPDNRSGCNSTFAMEGIEDFESACSRAREAFPEVWARMDFEVVPWSPDR